VSDGTSQDLCILKTFTVILPTGKRHPISPYLADYYGRVGLLKLSKTQPGIARLAKWLNAWPQANGSLRFETVTPPAYADRNALTAVDRLWRRILSLAPESDEPQEEQIYSLITGTPDAERKSSFSEL